MGEKEIAALNLKPRGCTCSASLIKIETSINALLVVECSLEESRCGNTMQTTLFSLLSFSLLSLAGGGSNKATALHGFFVLFIGAGWTGLVLASVFVLMNNAVKSDFKYKWANVHTHARLLEDDEMRGKDLGVI